MGQFMSQSVALSEVQLRQIAKCAVDCRCSRAHGSSDRFDGPGPGGEFATDYMSKIVDSHHNEVQVPANVGHQLVVKSVFTREAQYLHERQMGVTMWDVPFAVHDEALGTADGTNFNTDLRSLLDLDKNGVDCDDVYDAICMTNSVKGYQKRSTIDEDEDDQCSLRRHSLLRDVLVPEGANQDVLHVPAEFSQLRYDWLLPTSSMVAPSRVQQERFQRILKAFVRALHHGVVTWLRSDIGLQDEGPTSDVLVRISLSDDLARLSVEAQDVQRTLHLRSVRWVRPRADEELRAAVLQSSEQLSVVFRLIGGRVMCFAFDLPDQAAFFGTCMRILVKAARSDPARAERV